MIDFNTFFTTIYDKSKSLSHRTAVFFSMIGLIMIIELVFNFTYDIYISNKLNNLKTIHELKEIYQNDSVETEKLRADEIRILNRWHYSESLPFLNYSKSYRTDTIEIKISNTIESKPIVLNREDSLRLEQVLKLGEYNTGDRDYSGSLHFFDSLTTSNQSIIQKKEIRKTTNYNKSKIDKRSRIWMFVSSNYLFLLISLMLWIFPWFSKEQKKGSIFIGIFASQVMLIIIMLVVYWTAYFIPLLIGNPLCNYALNAIIHLALFILGTRIIIKASTKK